MCKESINKLNKLDAQIKNMNNKRIENNLNYSSFGWFNKCKEILEFSHKDIKDKNLINVLWSEVRELSNKQISLSDIMEDVQANS